MEDLTGTAERASSSEGPERDPTYSGNSKSREDILIQNGSSSQYFNEVLVSRALKGVRLSNGL